MKQSRNTFAHIVIGILLALFLASGFFYITHTIDRLDEEELHYDVGESQLFLLIDTKNRVAGLYMGNNSLTYFFVSNKTIERMRDTKLGEGDIKMLTLETRIG